MAKTKWIQKAIGKPGSLRRTVGVPEGKNIPKTTLDRLAKKGGVTGRRARLALTLQKMRNKR